jgi:hypothetical protein
MQISFKEFPRIIINTILHAIVPSEASFTLLDLRNLPCIVGLKSRVQNGETFAKSPRSAVYLRQLQFSLPGRFVVQASLKFACARREYPIVEALSKPTKMGR